MNPFGLIAVAVGIVLIGGPYYVLVKKTTPKKLEQINGSLGIYAMKASIYIISGGIVILVLGIVSLIGLLPWI